MQPSVDSILTLVHEHAQDVVDILIDAGQTVICRHIDQDSTFRQNQVALRCSSDNVVLPVRLLEEYGCIVDNIRNSITALTSIGGRNSCKECVAETPRKQ